MVNCVTVAKNAFTVIEGGELIQFYEQLDQGQKTVGTFCFHTPGLSYLREQIGY